MRLLSLLPVIFIVCLIAVAVPAMPAQALCVPWDIELSTGSGVPGTEITVYGHDFQEGDLVDLYYDGEIVVQDVRVNSKKEFTIIFTIPEGCTGHYEVKAKLPNTEAHAYFAVKPGLIVSPEKGPVGTTVTVEGRGFAREEEGIELLYYSNGNYETIERNIIADAKGSWDKSFQIPLSDKGDHKLDAEGDESGIYEVKDAIFRVTQDISIDKSSGIAGESITVTGSRFPSYEKNIKVLFDDQEVVTGIKANSAGDWEASFEAPELPAGEHIVTAEGERTLREDVVELSFEIIPDIVLSAGEGYAGMNLTVTGNGFAASEDVVILYDDSQVTTTETSDKGIFDASFLVPESKNGEYQVTAEDASQNTISSSFVMESDPPPAPELISPPDGGRAGLKNEATPTFEWSEVSGTIGVACYRLQIATSADVNADGEFANPLVFKESLVGSNYTLEESEALSYGSYYWIMQAVDSADNESEWSEPLSFSVGLLPRWGLIAAIVGAVLLLVALIRLLLKRRDIYYDRW